MGWIDSGIAKSRAAASDARADLAEVNRRLVFAEAWQKATGGGDAAARAVAGTWLGRQEALAPVLEIVTTQSDALHTRAVATVDDLQVKRQTALSRLTVAEKSRTAMTRLAEETDKLIGE